MTADSPEPGGALGEWPERGGFVVPELTARPVALDPVAGVIDDWLDDLVVGTNETKAVDVASGVGTLLVGAGNGEDPTTAGFMLMAGMFAAGTRGLTGCGAGPTIVVCGGAEAL